jgi:hypothetical protein
VRRERGVRALSGAVVNPADAIPPEWLAVAQSWAPYMLGVLALATVTARPALWCAERFRGFAVMTSATWDDRAAKRLVDALTWLVSATAWAWQFVPRVTMGASKKGGAK